MSTCDIFGKTNCKGREDFANRLFQLIILTLFMSTATFASGTPTDFDNAISAVFGDATNYFTFSGEFNSENNAITLSRVTRRGNHENFIAPLEISGSKKVRSGDTEITYTITLDNGADWDNHLFNFRGCDYPVKLILSGTAPANCKYLFYGCGGLCNLNLSDFDTSRLEKMSNMFRGCGLLTELDLSNLDTSNVTNMSNMLAGCTALEELDISGFDTSNVENMNDMFVNCSSLTELDVSNFDTRKVTSVRWMFNGCTGLKVLKIESDFPANPDMTDNEMEGMFGGRTTDQGKLMIFSETGFNPRFENFVKTYEYDGISYKDIITLLHLVLKIDTSKMLMFGQDTDVSFGAARGILFEGNSVLDNATDIKCPTEEGQRTYFVLADGATSSTIKNIFAVQHDNDFDETENVYGIKRGTITGNYARITEYGNETPLISIENDNEIYLESLTRLTGNDTVSLAIHTAGGESVDQNTVVIRNGSDDPTKIETKLSNNVNKAGYTPVNMKLQGALTFSGDNSGFVNGEVTTSGANIKFVNHNSMFNAPLTLTDNSVAEISESVDHNKDITVYSGSKLVIKKRSTLSGGTLELK